MQIMYNAGPKDPTPFIATAAELCRHGQAMLVLNRDHTHLDYKRHLSVDTTARVV